MKRARQILPVLIAALTLVFSSCGDYDTAIFFYLENEEKEIDNSLPNEITALGMGKIGTIYYVAAGGSIWRRDKASTLWSRSSMPGGESYVGALAAFAGGTELFVGTLNGIYRGGPGAWTKVIDGNVADKQILDIWAFETENILFACVMDGSNYDLVSSTDGTTWTLELDDSGTPFQQVARDIDTPTFYLAVTETQGYRGDPTGVPLVAFGSFGAMPVGVTFHGVYATAGPLYWLAGDQDEIYTSADLTNWSTHAAKDEDRTIYLTRIASTGPAGVLVVGSYGEDGFFEADGENPSLLTRIADTSPADLRSGAVLDFYVDTSDDTVFALTAGTGVWSSKWTGTEWGGWTHE